MKFNNRITLLSVLLIAAILTGCQAGDSPVTRDDNITTPTLNIPDEPEPEILYHPEALWTPRSVNAEEDRSSDVAYETENGTFYLGKYGKYDENGSQIEIALDQKIAIAAECDIGFGFSDGYYEQPDEIRDVVSFDMYNKYSSFGFEGNYYFGEDWLESQGFEVVKDHHHHYTRIQEDHISSDYYPRVLIITTPRQLAKFKMPYPQATFRFYGASQEDFIPPDYTPPSTEPEILYHPEALWTPSSVDTEDRYAYVAYETENGTFYIGRYGEYDKNGLKIKIDPDQKIAIAVSCDIGFPFAIGQEGPVEYSDLDAVIKDVISEEMYPKYTRLGASGEDWFAEDWLESQGFEVLKDHISHYSLLFSENPPDNYKYYHTALIITTPRQLEAFEMPYPQATFRFWGAAYEDYAPES